MPNPFPGMDPYLEAPGLWSAVHQFMIPDLARTLNPLLPPAYFAKPGERIYVLEEERRTIYPDTAVIRRPAEPPAAAASTAVLESDPPLVVTVDPVEVREGYVEIIRADGSGRVVTAIEVLSPRNKTIGHTGRELYLKKQDELLRSRTHLVEIDLLRQGPYTVAAPEPILAEQGPWHYVVSLHRGGEGGRYEVWTATVRDRLPRIHIPLDEPDPPVVIDLQDLLNLCYDEGFFDRQIDYTQEPPPPPFLRAELNWIDERLREQGLRADGNQS